MVIVAPKPTDEKLSVFTEFQQDFDVCSLECTHFGIQFKLGYYSPQLWRNYRGPRVSPNAVPWYIFLSWVDSFWLKFVCTFVYRCQDSGRSVGGLWSKMERTAGGETELFMRVLEMDYCCAGKLVLVSTAGWANSITGQKLSVCLCVNQGSSNHNRYT